MAFRVLGWLGVLLAGGSPSFAGPALSCDSVCHREVGSKTIERQWDRLFRGQRVCRMEGGIREGEDPARWIEAHADPLTGVRMATAVLTGGCSMNRPVRDGFRQTMEAEGSQGLVRRAFEMAGLESKPGCIREISAGASLAGGDVLRLGRQAMIVASVGEDPFGIDARMAAHSGLVASDGAEQLCREWLMDSSKFQLSVIFLSQEGRRGWKVRQGTFGALVGEEHPGSQWDRALQEWALPDCVQKVSGRRQRGAVPTPSRLKVERHQVSVAGCRVSLPAIAPVSDRECALCCALGGRAP